MNRVRLRLCNSWARWAQGMRRRPAAELLLSLSLLAVMPMAAPTGGLDVLTNTPMSHFSDEDTDLMMKNARSVLDAPEPRAKQEWRNPKTGNSGRAEVKSQFTATDGALCKRLRVANAAKGIEGESTYVVCKYQDRGWLIKLDARPAASSPKGG